MNKRRRRWGLIFLSLLSCVWLLSGCSSAYFVKIDGQKLKVSDLDKKYAAAEAIYKPQYEGMGREFDSSLQDRLRSDIAQYMIMNEVIRADCQAHNWDINVPEVQQDINDSKERQGTESFQMYLDSLGMTEKQLLQCLAHYYYVTEDVTVTEEYVKQFYLDNLDNPEFRDLAETVTARHILVDTEEEALDIISRLNAGEDFAALVQEKSTDPGSKDNGGVYTFIRGEMVTEFEETAFTLNPGELSEPVKTDYGYHIIEVMEHKAAATEEDFETYRVMMEESALQEAKDAKYGLVYNELMGKAVIEYASGYEFLKTESDTEPVPDTGSDSEPNTDTAPDTEQETAPEATPDQVE